MAKEWRATGTAVSALSKLDEAALALLSQNASPTAPSP